MSYLKLNCFISLTAFAILFQADVIGSVRAAETDTLQIDAAAMARSETSGTVLVFRKADSNEAVAVRRPDAQIAANASADSSLRVDKVKAAVRALVDGPLPSEEAAGVSNALPSGSTVAALRATDDGHVDLDIDIPSSALTNGRLNAATAQAIVTQFEETLVPLGMHEFRLRAKSDVSGDYRSLLDLTRGGQAPNGPLPEAAAADLGFHEMSPLAGQTEPNAAGAPPVPVSQGTGALAGKTVVLNQAHGWLDDTGSWRVQREKLFENLEDLECAEFMNMYVLPQLQNAGATVHTVREPDLQSNMAIVDNAMGSPKYVETGTWTNSSASRGFVDKSTASWSGLTADPWANAAATRYASAVVGTPTATATYTPVIPADGYYNVYLAWSRGTDRSTQAHWQVWDTGGVHDIYVDQTVNGAMWNLVGNFYFRAGSNPATGKVVVLNDGPIAGKIVALDAVRFGGGMGDVARRTHGVSGKPRWQEEAVNYMQYNGMRDPAYTFMTGDDTAGSDDEQLGWGDRPQYANWIAQRNSATASTVYVGYHSNSVSGGCSGGTEVAGTARGTTTYRDVDADATAGTENLTQVCHDAVISNLRAFYQSTWQDRGIVGSNGYGESSQSNLGSVPGFFFESLFHDNPSDMNPGKDPKFRFIFARGIAQGVITYFGGTTFPPETPTNFRVKNIGGGFAQLNWTAGPARSGSASPYGSAATGYRVFQSTDGRGWSQGTTAATNTLNVSLTSGQTTYFRVAALNAGGVSFPTETLAVRLPASGATPVVIVNGYNRYDRFLPPLVAAVSGCADNLVRRVDYRLFNSFSYAVEHSSALTVAGLAFDSCADECVEAGQVSLPTYSAVDWIGAQEAEADSGDNEDNMSLKSLGRAAVQSYLEGGGKLLMSNSELAWDSDRDVNRPAAQRNFLHNYMKANYSSDDSGTYQATGAAGGIFSAIGAINFDNGTGGTYDVRFPDVLTVNGSTAALTYIGGTGGTAAVQYAGPFNGSSTPGKVVYIGFGLETIVNQSIRNSVMAATMGFFGLTGSRVNGWELY